MGSSLPLASRWDPCPSARSGAGSNPVIPPLASHPSLKPLPEVVAVERNAPALGRIPPQLQGREFASQSHSSVSPSFPMLPPEELGGKTKEFHRESSKPKGQVRLWNALSVFFLLSCASCHLLLPPTPLFPSLIPKSCVFPAFFFPVGSMAWDACVCGGCSHDSLSVFQIVTNKSIP